MRNSPGLMTFSADTRHFYDVNGKNIFIPDFIASLQVQFKDRKLFTAGYFHLKKIEPQHSDVVDIAVQTDYILHQQDSDLVNLF